MTSNEFNSLQVGMFICDSEDTQSPENYCMILQFGRNGMMRLQSYNERGESSMAYPYWIDRREVHLTNKMYPSEYYELSHRLM